MTTALVTSELVGTALSWLLTYLIHSTIAILAVWLLVSGIKPIAAKISPSAANLGWKLALVGAFMTATVQIAVGVRPALGALEFDSGAAVVAHETAERTPAGQSSVEQAPVLIAPASPSATTPVLFNSHETAVEAAVTAAEPAPLWPKLLLLAWAIGAALAGIRLLVCTRTLRRRLHDRAPVLEDPVLEAFLTLCRDAEVTRQIKLTQSSRITSPVALWRREIVVPERAVSELSPAAMRSVLAHELAHLLRRDPYWLAVAAVIEALCFFQPLNRLARRGMQESAELLCDDWAIAHTGDGVVFAKSLAEVATWEHVNRSSVLVAGMISGEGPIVGRVRRALDGDPRRFESDSSPRPSRMLVAVGGLAALIMVAPGAVAASPPANNEGPSKRDLRAQQHAQNQAEKAQREAEEAQARADAAKLEAERLAEQARSAAAAAAPNTPAPAPSGSHLILRDGDEYLMIDENGVRLRSKDADIDIIDGQNPRMRMHVREGQQEFDLDLDLDDLDAIGDIAIGMLGQEMFGSGGLGGSGPNGAGAGFEMDSLDDLGGVLDAFGGLGGLDQEALERELEAVEHELEQHLLRELGRSFGAGGSEPIRSHAPPLSGPRLPTAPATPPAPPTTMI